MPKLECEVIQACFINGSQVILDQRTGVRTLIAMEDRVVYPEMIVEVDVSHPLGGKHTGEWLRPLRGFDDKGRPISVEDARRSNSGASEADGRKK